jgi:hypothetical protein
VRHPSRWRCRWRRRWRRRWLAPSLVAGVAGEAAQKQMSRFFTFNEGRRLTNAHWSSERGFAALVSNSGKEVSERSERSERSKRASE